MADVNDYLNACRDTDVALSRTLEHEHDTNYDGSYAALLSAELIALAIREFGTRLDYVLRDIERRHP